MAFSLLVILPVALPSGAVSAQSSGYSIDSVDHQIQVMYSGHLVIQDTVHVSGQATNGFMIGLPYKYSAYVLQALAYDENQVYQMNLGVQLGDHSGFYGAQVNFNGSSPSVFTVAFVLSNRLITEQSDGSLSLDFPAYPSFTQDVGTCNVSIIFPNVPSGLSINKDDGSTSSANYVKTNLLAYTYSLATASFQVKVGTLQLTTISNLNRQVTIDSSGKVSVSDSYRITDNSTTSLNSFVFNVPIDAENVVVKDSVGRSLSSVLASSTNGNTLQANATLFTFLTYGQSTTMTVQYNLPSAKIEGSHYVLGAFMLFPEFSYYVEHASVMFIPPEGATILIPQLASLDSYSSLTRDTFQDTLTVTRDGVSFLDYSVPEPNSIHFSYDYNPVWVSFRPTFWASFLAVVGCIAVVFVRRRKPKDEETIVTRSERLPTIRPAAGSTEQAKAVEIKPSQRVTADNIKEFVDAFEDKKQLNAELKSLDARAQKGKIPRRQYKVQRRAIEIRLEGLNRNIDRTKEVLRGSSSVYADLARQLDSAEADLAEAEENIKDLESRQTKGEISIEFYKKNIGDYQKHRDKAESAINGILLRLREKIH